MGELKHINAQFRLVEAVRNNNEQVLEQLYQECFRKVEVFVLKNNGTKPQAKDTYQEAFIAVWQNVKEGRFTPENESALQGYLYQIAKNKWMDILRSSRFRKTTQLVKNDLLEGGYESDSDTDLTIEKDHRLSKAMESFQKLGPECRELLTGFYFEKKSLRELAAFFKIEEASARNKKYRCIQKLRELTVTPNK
jgi:RNA polymerase sigma factor (sigma-70 family)